MENSDNINLPGSDAVNTHWHPETPAPVPVVLVEQNNAEEKPEVKGQEPQNSPSSSFIFRSVGVVLLVVLLIIGILIPLRVVPGLFSGLSTSTAQSFFNFFVKNTATSTVSNISMSTTTVNVMPVNNATSSSIINGTSTSSAPNMYGQANGQNGPSAVTNNSNNNSNTYNPNSSGWINYSNNTTNKPTSTGGSNTANSGTTNYGTSNTTATQKTPADLAIHFVSFGVVDASGNIVQTSTVHSYDRVALKFNVNNAGGTVSSGWYFIARLPTQDVASQTVNSGDEKALSPGSGIIATLGFGNLTPGNAIITVTIYPSGSDSSSANNTIQIPVTVTQDYDNTYYYPQ